MKKTGAAEDLCSAGPGDVACDVCTGRKRKALKSCLVCLVSFCREHLQPHREAPAFRRHQLVPPSERLRETICSEHEEVKKMFCRSDRQLICHLCAVDHHKDHDVVSAAKEKRERETDVDRSPGRIQQKSLREELLKFSRDITLDPNTAGAALMLSEGNKKAKNMGEDQFHPHQDRFNHHQVMSQESLTGRCYWEVKITGVVFVAVSYKSIRDKGVFGCDDKSWSLFCDDSGCAILHNSVVADVTRVGPSTVGVYLDHSAGRLCFYDVSETMTLIHRVQTSFTEPLHAGVMVFTSCEIVKLK